MAKVQTGKTYAQIVNGRCHWIFTQAELPEWNESHIQVVDVTGNVPNVGDTWNGVSFSPYIPPPLTQAQINAAADRMMQKHFNDNIDTILEALEAASAGPNKAAIKAVNNKVKAEKTKKV